MVRSLRAISVIGASLLAVGVVGAQPKKPAPKGPIAPAKEPDPTATPPAPTDGSGSAVTPVEEPPPSDMNGTDENPDNPKGVDQPDPNKVVAVPEKSKKAGYPTEEALRPITLPQNMSEVSIGPHAVLGLGSSEYEGADALRARYGIIREVQIGLTYVMGGIFHQPAGSSAPQGPIKFKPGKAVGLDFSVLLTNFLAVKVGVPIYIDPVAVGLNIGAPMKFIFADKFAIGGLDDLVSIKISKFAPSFYSEGENARQAFEITSGTKTATSRGTLRFSTYGVYQHDPKLAVIARFGLSFDDFSTNKTAAGGGSTTFLRGGIQYAVKRYLDLGLSVGWESLANLSSIGPAGFLAVRI